LPFCSEQYLLERLPLLRRKPAQVGAILGSRFGCDVVLDQDRIVVPAVRGAASVLQRQRHDLRVARFAVRQRERPLLPTGPDMARNLTFTGLSQRPQVRLNGRPVEVAAAASGGFQIALI
jgi:hypothetical protein